MSRYIDADVIDYKHYKQHKHGKFNTELLGDAKTLEEAFYQGVMYIHNCIEETPTADVIPKEIADEAYAHGYTEAESKYRAILERKRGEWIIDDAFIEHCSMCKHRFYTSALFAVGGNDEPPCCPNCGVRNKRSGR